MSAILGTVLYAAIAAAIVFGIIVPLYRRFFARHQLPGNSDMVGFVFLLLAIGPLAAAIMTMAVFLALGVIVGLLAFTGWLTNSDLFHYFGHLASELTPSFLNTIPSGEIILAVYAVCYLVFFANGVRMIIRLRE